MGIAKLHRWIRRFVVVAITLLLGWAAFIYLKARPQDLPWTRLTLDEPVGLFTGRKLARLTGDRARCMALLRQTGLRFNEVEPHKAGRCPVEDAVHISPGQAMLAFSPSTVAPSCPVVAGVAMWQWQIVEPAAQRIFGASIMKIDHYGSYACRRIYGRQTGTWSEHATADAIDVSGFALSDGTRIRVAADWEGEGKKALFLREVRDGACRLFSTVLSPDYNAQHHDHLHLDQAERGAMGWRTCR